MALNSVIIAPEYILRRLQGEYEELGGYKPVAQQYGVSAAMVWQILNNGYVPAKAETGIKLGYVPGCPNCGHEFEESE